MSAEDFIMTIDSDGEEPPEIGRKQQTSAEEGVLDPLFTFEVSTDPFLDALEEDNHVSDSVRESSAKVRCYWYVTVL